ncbi:MAG: NifB/NifX family molybdenum-iron cluster-binding protein [Thiobacillaceae bacterium]
MKVAVTSQNRKTITGHAGKCRKFWIYEIEDRTIKGKSLLELPKEQSFYESHGAPHPLDEINVLIWGGMGSGLTQRLLQKGIEGWVTSETDPDQAITAYLEGRLETLPPEEHHDHSDHQH